MALTKGFTETKEYKEMSDEEKLKFLEESTAETLDELEEAKAALKENDNKSDEKTATELRQANERIEMLEKSLRRQRFTALVKDGQWLGDIEGHVAMLETLADATGGEDTERVKAYIERENSLAEQNAKSELFSERGHSRQVTEQETEFQKALKAYKEVNVTATEAEAMSAVLQANPKFYNEYRQAMHESAARGEEGIVSI